MVTAGASTAPKKRIFAAHVLSRPAVERRAVQVDGRRQHLLTACDA
ncbi:hypothetical protein PSYPI_11819, partial [Pseudomonas syringae pv. pisi str. 1704B]